MKSERTILVADDEPNIRRVLEALFLKSGYKVFTAENGRSAISIASSNPVDILISDLIMPDMSGVDVLRSVKEIQPQCAAILVTAHGTIRTAVDAMRLGAFNYVTKPFDLDELQKMVKQALSEVDAPKEASPRSRKITQPVRVENMVGQSPAMQEVFRLVKKAAESRATVLIRGESGTGKELIARALHSHSNRADKPFIAVSCAALPETLLESELFGYEKHAFTGAGAQKPGRFELANNGTLFMDEVADIPPSIQVKLLRVLQEREFERLGGTKSVRVDVRLIAATNRDVEKAVAEGQFRDDLYYRLQVISINLPPLRERREDILVLAAALLKKYCKENNRKLKTIDPEAERLLLAYRYPGNIRELENAMERATVMAEPGATVLTPDLLPLTIQRFVA